jgi:hypothetical protein
MIPDGTMAAKEFGFFYEGGVFHLFWMRHETTVPMDSTEREIGHAVSTDLTHWTQLQTAVAARPAYWDDRHVWSPHVMRQDSTYLMYYTGITDVPYQWSWYQRIGAATSPDLVHWTPLDAPVFSASSVPWTSADSSRFEGCQFRDPCVIPDPTQPGKYLMYYVTVPTQASDQLIVGVARGDGGTSGWTDLGPLWCTDRAHYWGWCESPLVFEHDGLWYLFVNTDSGHPVRFRTAPSPLADSTEWSGHYSLWDMTGQDPASDVLFGAEVLNVGDRWFMAIVNSLTNGIDLLEMIWGEPPAFSLVNPVTAVGSGERPSALGLSRLGGTRRGGHDVFRLSLPAAGEARLEVFDVAGRRARVLHAGPLPAGESLAEWDGRDDAGVAVPHGVFFVRLATGGDSRALRVPRTN